MTNTAWENSILAYNHPSNMPSVVRRVCRPQLRQRNGTGRTRGTPQQSCQPICFVFFSDRRLCVFVPWALKGHPLQIKCLWLYMCFRCHFCTELVCFAMVVYKKEESNDYMTTAALCHSFGCGIFFLGTAHEKIATQHCIASCSLPAASSKIWLFRFLERI